MKEALQAYSLKGLYTPLDDRVYRTLSPGIDDVRLTYKALGFFPTKSAQYHGFSFPGAIGQPAMPPWVSMIGPSFSFTRACAVGPRIIAGSSQKMNEDTDHSDT